MNIKRTLAASLLALSVALATAQSHHEFNFLVPVTSIIVSNTLSWTNLNTVAVASPTNIVGLNYTNLLGNLVTVAAGDTAALAVDVPLWSDRNGNIPISFPGYTNGTFDVPLSGMEVSVHFARCGSGVSTTAINLVFVPLFDGVHESTAAADLWTVGVTPSASKTVCISTNVPIWMWPAAKTLRLQRITSTRGAASGDVAIDSITLNGFVP